MLRRDAPTFSSTARRGFIHDPAANPNPNNIQQYSIPLPAQEQVQTPQAKKKRSLPGTPDPEAEVVALSPRTLMATNRFVCEICNRGFQRDQNLQLHRRGHNLPWKLKQRSTKEMKKKVYVCPEKSCVHHEPSRALGDLTGIKKHFSRKHGEKRWKCDKCSKKYAVRSDWKAHVKTCGTREYNCDCGTIFSRKDSFITHRAFCDALTKESMRLSPSIVSAATDTDDGALGTDHHHNGLDHFALPNLFMERTTHGEVPNQKPAEPSTVLLDRPAALNPAYFNPINAASTCGGVDLLAVGSSMGFPDTPRMKESLVPMIYSSNTARGQEADGSTHMSATALLQKAAQMGAAASCPSSSLFAGMGGVVGSIKGLPSKINPDGVQVARGSVGPSGNFGGETSTRLPAPTNGETTHQMAAPSNVKDNHNPWSIGGATGSLTRDFLGVGEESSCRPFSQQELSKITATMGPGVDVMSSRSKVN